MGPFGVKKADVEKLGGRGGFLLKSGDRVFVQSRIDIVSGHIWGLR